MKKLISFFQNKIVLKYLLIAIFITLGLLFFLSSSKNEPLLKLKKDNSAEVKRLTDSADILYDSNKLERSLYYYNKAKAICDAKTNPKDYVYAISCMSDIKQNEGDFTASEAIATEALPYLKSIKNPRYTWIIYNTIGLNYLNSYNYNNAILYFKKAISLKTSSWRKSMAINNLAVVYMEQRKYKEAAELLYILSLHKKISKYEDINESQDGFVTDNLGFCYYKLKNPKALDCYYKALKTRLKIKDNIGLIYSYKHLCVYFQNNNPNLAKDYAKKGYNIATQINNPTTRIECLALLMKNSTNNDLRKYSKMYIKIVDSIDVVKKKTKNQSANLKYLAKNDKNENLQLKSQKIENELQLEREKNRNIISYIIILFITTLSLLLYFQLRSKGKKEKDLATYESEIRISKKLNEELANEVFHTLTFVKSNNLELDENKEQLLNNLDTIYSRTRNISKENSTIVTDDHYVIALKEMISEFKTTNINILSNGFDTIPWNEIDKNKKITVYRVLQELFLNMKKHSKATLVSITLKKQNKKIIVNYSDNGVGPKNKNIILKNGLQNVESRIKTINGTIIFDNNSKKGFKLSFYFPQ